MISREEIELIERLSYPPKCMHGDPFYPPDIEDLGDCWKCNRCGLVAKKIVMGES